MINEEIKLYRALKKQIQMEKEKEKIMERIIRDQWKVEVLGRLKKKKVICPKCGQEGYLEWKSIKGVIAPYVRHPYRDGQNRLHLKSHYYSLGSPRGY